ncbi:hypothetical protein M9H77_27695 [Catharanthus roseus]|uniref:Uncharacterized protein n=1 Tax=Catharanthus roseus TaxID=4058 RepID=A0ACC0AD84_CATRO|nr:hypothetical protein M9H77_27695 [Catharanthus roseus]
MVRPNGSGGDDDLGPVTDRTSRVEGRTIIASSRGVRGRRSTFDFPATPTHLAPSFHHGTGEPGSSTQPPAMFGTAPQDLSCSTHGYSHVEYGVSSSIPYVPRPTDRVGEEQERVGSLHIEGEMDEKGDDDDDGSDDDQDKGDDAGDEEQPVPVAPMAHSSRSDECPRHGKRKGMTGNFISVMSKIVGSRNRRLEVAREVSAPTQKRKKVKASDWEQTGPTEGGPIDPELILSYDGHVVGPIWHGQDHGSLKF